MTLTSNNRFERSRGASSWAKEGVDDWDKVSSFIVGEAPRRSTSSLAVIRASALYLAN